MVIQPHPAVLPLAPREPLDAHGVPRLGAYAGSLERIDLSPLLGKGLRGLARRLVRLKRWQYAMAASPEVVVCFAIADLGYAANGFVFVADRREGRLLFDQGFLGAPGLSAQVGERPAEGARARFRAPGVSMRFEREGGLYRADVRVGARLGMHFVLDGIAGPRPVTLIVRIPGGTLNVTQKVSALPARGSVVIGGRQYSLDGGFGGLDHTHGLLARENAWRWAFGGGRAADGSPVGFNLGEGFNESTPGENALWIDGEPQLLPGCRFQLDRHAPLHPWVLRSDDGRIDLTFRTYGAHRELRNLVVAASRFVQVAGEFEGRLVTESGRAIELRALPGVVEDQLVRW